MRNLLVALLCSLSIILMPAAMAQSAPQKKKWTFLIFLNGNNSLDDFGTTNLKQLESIGSTDDINVVVEWASYEKRKTVRLLVQKSTNSDEVTSPIVEDLGLTDMGDVNTLKDFIGWGVKNYPADHYFIDVWNHGSGWQKKRRFSSDYRDISYDDISGNVIKTEQLGDAMAYARHVIGHNVDVYGSDACLMAMIEVANEVSDSVNYFVGSEELEPGAGWPYDKFLADWTAQPDMSPASVAATLVKNYGIFYADDREVTLSAFDLSKLPALNLAIAQLDKSILNLNTQDSSTLLNVASNETQAFDYGSEGYRDLIDFMTKLKIHKLSGLEKADIKNIIKKANRLVIANSASSDMPGAHGVSIWLPTNNGALSSHPELTNRYRNLKFNQSTQWEKVLEYLLGDSPSQET